MLFQIKCNLVIQIYLLIFRWYGGVALTCMLLLIVIFQIVGLLLGCLSYRKNTIPTERGCVGNCAGCFLMT